MLGINLRKWSIENTDTGDVIFGDFEAEDLTVNISATYAESFALNSQEGILQFLHGNSNTITFGATFFDDSIVGFAGLGGAAEAIAANIAGGPIKALSKLELLSEWVQRDDDLSRPPVVLFTAGDGFLSQLSVIDSIGGVKFGALGSFGEPKLITCAISLRAYVPFDFEGVAETYEPPSTRYHRARAGDYFELIAAREYNKPIFGDVIRRAHPDLQIVQPLDVVKLPSFLAIRQESTRAPQSVPLKTLTAKKTTAQTALRDAFFDARSASFYSTVVPEGV